MTNNQEWSARNVLYLALAVIVAVGIWFYVDEKDGRTAVVTIPDVTIEYLGEAGLADRGLMLLMGEDSGTELNLSLELEGRRRKVVQMDHSKVRVTADLSKITAAGVQTVPVTTSFTDRKLGSDVIRNNTGISSVTVNIVELNRKNIEVRCELVGNVAKGYTAGKLSLSKDMIEVRGQASDVDTVSYAKVVLDIGKDTKASVSEVLTCSFYDENDRLMTGHELHTKDLDVTAYLPVYVTKELKLKVDFLEAEGVRLENMIWSIAPESIVVSGDASVLNGMDSIVLDQFDLREVGNDVSTHSYSIIVPDGCENLSGVTRATMEIAYPELASRVLEIPDTQLRYLNAPTDKNITVLSDSMEVEIFGPAVVVESITPLDVELMVDLSDYAALTGTCTVTAVGKVNDELDIGFRGAYEIQVDISEEAF